MMRRLAPCFSGMPAIWLNEAGGPVYNDRGQLATDDNVCRSGYFTEIDRLFLDLCSKERAAGEHLPDWQLKEEVAAFQRQRNRGAA
jgi:hypothetical protein